MSVSWVAVLVAAVAMPIGLFLLAKYSVVRLWIFVGGAVLVLQSADGLSAGKLTYFAVAVLCAIISLLRVTSLGKSEWWPAFRPALLGASILFALIVVTAAFSLLRGEEFVRVARDSLTYLLICAAPLIGLDAASAVTPKVVHRSIVVLCSVASLSFAVFWLSRRGASSSDLDRLVLASMMLVAIGVAVGIVRGLTPKIHLGWLAFGMFALGSVLITGTRTGLVLVVALVAAVGAQRKYRIPLPRFLGGIAILSLSSLIVLPMLSSRFASAGFFQNRLNTLLNTFDNGVLSDASGVIRARAYDYATRIWSQDPLFGVGLGHSFPNPNPMQPNADFQLDTPVLYLAKFGVLGTAVILIALILIAVPALQMHHRIAGPTIGQTAAKVFILTWVLILPFGTPTEDKGFALALALMFLMLGSEAKETMRTKPDLALPKSKAVGGSRATATRLGRDVTS